MLKRHSKDLVSMWLARASLIRIAFSHMLDGYGMGIITRNGYPIQKCDCFPG